MRWRRVSCNISSWYFSHNISVLKGEQNSKRVTKRFFSLFASWLIHASHMHVSHSALSWSNPNVPQVAWNVGSFVLSIVQRCSKKVAHGTTVSRRRRKKRSPMARCTKYIRPIAFSPRCRLTKLFINFFKHDQHGSSRTPRSAHPHFQRYMQSRRSRWFFGGQHASPQ